MIKHIQWVSSSGRCRAPGSVLSLVFAACVLAPAVVMAQAVCLPAPRLLTTKPMGGQAGAEFEVAITGEHFENAEELVFSHPGISAVPKTGSDGAPEPNKFLVTIADDCPPGVYEASVMTRLGVSSSRAFSVGDLPEVTQTEPNTSLDQAMSLPVNSICNAVAAARGVAHYSFAARQGQRIVVDCAAQGIDSKLKPVLVIADQKGRDLLVERRGGALDFTAPEAGTYLIKVHDLTYDGGAEFFYRLGLREISADDPVLRLPSTAAVHSFSWPPVGLAEQAVSSESEPNNEHTQAQKISLPCDLEGSFYPAADVDRFEFAAQKGDVWWVEVASERLGFPTDPFILFQRVSPAANDTSGALIDVVELNDIPSPVKVSSNAYAYDGPPYNAGTSDILGKIEIPEDGVYRLQLSDLFGGTRNVPEHTYRLVIRRAAPDFALVCWALHMELRNGDRNALSKPFALRGGGTVALEVVAIRRDGFDGEIELEVEGLPPGVTASGLRIPAGKSRGVILVTADQDAPRGLAHATFVGRASINGTSVTRPCQLASMAWPVKDAWQEIPQPRLVAHVPISVGGSEFAPLTIEAIEDQVWEARVGEKLTIPLVLTRRCEFSGATLQLKTFGDCFERCGAFEVPLNAETSEAVLDLAQLNPEPGDYEIAFYGSAVAKYRYNPEAVAAAEEARREAQHELTALEARLQELSQEAAAAPATSKAELERAATAAAEKKERAEAAVAAADQRLKEATQQAQPRDIVDIIVSKPIAIRVQPAVNK